MPGTDQPSDDELVGGLLLRGLDVAYQPIVDLGSGELIGWEALLRGRLPEGEALDPEHVVGSASRIGALDAVMRQVAEQALTTAAAASQRLGRAMTVSVNIEPDQLRADSPFLRWIVERSSGSPARLLLEMTERGEDASWTGDRAQVLDTLLAAGVPLAIDDLGTGASRIRLLGSREWTWVKLDRELLLLGERGRVLLRHLTAMLHELGSTVLLEGVATPEDLQTAREAGVDLVQGHHLGVPVSAGALLAGLVLPTPP